MAIGVSCKRQNLYDMQPQFERLTDDQLKGIKRIFRTPSTKRSGKKIPVREEREDISVVLVKVEDYFGSIWQF
jgi:hypothetical protein